MHNQAQRDQWDEHLRDEAGAIAEQQASAGDTHGPVEGPLPHTRNDTAAAAEDAVLMEREQCAAVAGAFAGESKLLEVLPGATPQQLQWAAGLAHRIAQAIRTRGDPNA